MSLKWDLKLEEDGGKWVLSKCLGLIPAGTAVLCEWRDRKALLQGWLDGSEDGDLTEILRDLPSILRESEWLTPERKLRVADWVIDAFFQKHLAPEWEDVLYQTVQTLLFHVLIPLFPNANVASCPEELRNALHYTLRRWFALVKDLQRSWFERRFEKTKYSREQAMREALFNSKGRLHSFYVLPGFPELAQEFATWFLSHYYDLITCAKIHAALYHIKHGGQSWWRKSCWPVIKFLFITRGYWWVWGLVFSLLLILSGLLSPFLSGSAALNVRLLLVVGGISALPPFLVRALILLRMLGAIGVGYILLLITTEAWEFAFRIWQDHLALASIISFSCLLASFLYLVVEMGSKVPSRGKRYLRSLLVLGVGLAQSLLIGMAACSLIGAVFMGEVMRRQGPGIPDFTKFQIHYRPFSLDFVLYPEIVLFFAPVALFVGIFSQILWEEKAITSPL